MNLQELILLAKKGDAAAQRNIYDMFSGKMHGICLRYASCTDDAQDILQDSFITIFNKIKQFNSTGSFEGWCLRIAINTALKRYRGVKVYKLSDDYEVSCDAEFDSFDETTPDIAMDDLLLMIQQLPDRYRLCFSMYAIDGFSHKQIATVMQINTGTSKSNLSRARKILQAKINNWKPQDLKLKSQ